MPLPKALRSRTPNALRDNPRLRALALGAGLIPPRTMHAPEEAALLAQLAEGQRTVVEIGVFEGSSAIVLCRDARRGRRPASDRPVRGRERLGAAGRLGRQRIGHPPRGGASRARGGAEAALARGAQPGRGRALDRSPWTWSFVDGDHSPEGVLEDWNAWHPHVRPGGVMAFHDASEPDSGPTVVVDELFRGPSPLADWEITHEVGQHRGRDLHPYPR